MTPVEKRPPQRGSFSYNARPPTPQSQTVFGIVRKNEQNERNINLTFVREYGIICSYFQGDGNNSNGIEKHSHSVIKKGRQNGGFFSKVLDNPSKV